MAAERDDPDPCDDGTSTTAVPVTITGVQLRVTSALPCQHDRPDGRRGALCTPQGREREILDATRELFDARGVRDAQIEDIARAVGVNRAIIYRHFTGKEELFALTLVGYLDDLEARLAAAASTRSPRGSGSRH